MDIQYYLKCRNVERLSQVYIHRNYNLMSHQWMTGMLFRHFASLEDVPYDINVWDIVLNHDILETISTDLPWPIKNFSDKTKDAWSVIENELINKHFQLLKYSDENIKKSLNARQFALFKMCDILDLWLFVKEEISIGNNSKQIKEVEENCYKIFDSIEFKFHNIIKFIESYDK